MLSTRIRKFHELVRQANDQPSYWLRNAIREPGEYQSKLATLACLRVLVCRHGGGRPYQETKATVKAQLLRVK